jgi:hypothetical protein
MTRRGGGLEHLIIHNRGRKAIKEGDLAYQCGLTVEQMYRRVGYRLLLFSRGSWFEVQPEKHREELRRKSLNSRPDIAFVLSGVIMMTASLGMKQALKAGMALMPLLRTRRRSSKNRERRPRRANDPPRQAEYAKVFAKLQSQMRKLLEGWPLGVTPKK